MRRMLAMVVAVLTVGPLTACAQPAPTSVKEVPVVTPNAAAGQPGCELAPVEYVNAVLGTDAVECEAMTIGGSITVYYRGVPAGEAANIPAVITYVGGMTPEKFAKIKAGLTLGDVSVGGLSDLPSPEFGTVDYPGLGDEAYISSLTIGGYGPSSTKFIARQGSLQIIVVAQAPADTQAELIRALFRALAPPPA